MLFIYKLVISLIPQKVRGWINKRWDRGDSHNNGNAFDLMRASVNLIVAAAIISYATSQKLPLSTTYVTFMVAMGTALADKAWSRDCAPHRISGILTVVGGWFITAILAFLMAGTTVTVIYFTRSYGLSLLLLIVGIITYKLFHLHKGRNGGEQVST